MINIQKKYLKEIKKIRKDRDAYYKRTDAAISKMAEEMGLSSEEDIETFWSYVINNDDYFVQVVSSK